MVIKLKHIVIVIFVLVILGVSVVSAAEPNSEFKNIKISNGINIEGNQVTLNNQVIGNITKVNSISDGESQIQDKEAIKEVYDNSIEYLALNGEYFIFESNSDYYMIYINESDMNIAKSVKNLVSENSNVFMPSISGATDSNGFDLEIKNSNII